jgi:hypothetical protein
MKQTNKKWQILLVNRVCWILFGQFECCGEWLGEHVQVSFGGNQFGIISAQTLAFRGMCNFIFVPLLIYKMKLADYLTELLPTDTVFANFFDQINPFKNVRYVIKSPFLNAQNIKIKEFEHYSIYIFFKFYTKILGRFIQIEYLQLNK